MQLFRFINIVEANDKQLLIDVTLSIDRRRRFSVRNAECSTVYKKLAAVLETTIHRQSHLKFTFYVCVNQR